MTALERAVRAARRAVVFTGAGISQESGLGTFRGPGGLWERFRPEDLATPEAFARDPALVSRWYADRFATMRAAQPNAGHLAIARWEALFPSLVVVTQNIDRLHQRAGSSHVLELHGTVWISRCARCEVEVATEELAAAGAPPASCACGGLFRPGVVWFGERLPERVFAEAAEASSVADLVVVVGTSGTVWPAAGLVELAARGGAAIVEVNREATPLSALATVTLRGAAGEILPRLTEEWSAWRSHS